MKKTLIFLAVAVLTACALSACAQERTTPVTVTNPVAIDSVNNTVKATVTNTPNVNVMNSPTVSISTANNTVKAQQSGTWNAAVTGTVTTNTSSKTVMLFASNQTLANNSYIDTSVIN